MRASRGGSALAAIAAGAIAFAVGVVSIVLASAAPGLGSLAVLAGAVVPLTVSAAVGLIVPIIAVRRRAQPRWAPITGLILGVIAAVWASYVLIMYLALWFQFSGSV